MKKEEHYSKEDNAGVPRIIHTASSFVVVYKPAGIVTHEDHQHVDGTLSHFLVQHFPEMRGVGDAPEVRPGIVHRLDKGVSGVVVAARTQQGYEYLKSLFMSRQVHKEYHALVHGVVSKEEGEIARPIVRKRTGKAAAVTTPPRDADSVREAITRYEVMERFLHYTLLRAYPLTGRTHQIRTHLLSIGHPIVGDRTYTTKRFFVHEKNMKKRFPSLEHRLWLHAYRISFPDSEGRMLAFTAPVPDDMIEVLSYLRERQPARV